MALALPPGERKMGPGRPEKSCFSYFMLNDKCFS